MQRFSRLFAFSISIVTLALSACQLPPDRRGVGAADQPLSTALGSPAGVPDPLQRLAAAESRSRQLQPLDVPTPPGVEPDALAERTVAQALAGLELREALQFIMSADDAIADGDSPAAQPDVQPDAAPEPVDPAAEDQAMRDYALGRDDALQRRHLSAVTHFLKAAELMPGNVSILRELARSYLALGNQARALQTYEQILEQEPEQSEALFMAALAAADRREFERAVRLLGRKVADGESFTHDPGADLLARYVLGVALAQLGYDTASIEATTQVLEQIDSTSTASMYGPRLGALYRQRGELWRSIGDAYCRRGDYADALQAYDRSAELPTPDPYALAPRVLYANLRMGRVHHAQLELYAALLNEAPQVSERLIGLCSYLRDHGGPMQTLADSIVRLQRQHPDDPSLVRAAATLLDASQATALLREYVSAQPDNIDVVGELLRWLAASDLNAAMTFAEQIISQQPKLTNAIVQELFQAVSRPSDAVRAARRLPDSPETAVIEGRLLLMMGGIGPAWQALEQPAARWPEHLALHQTRMEVAAALEEPSLLSDVIEQWPAAVDADVLLARSRALRRVGLGMQAVMAAERAVDLQPDNPDALTELAWAHLSLGLEQTSESDAALHAQDAVQYAERAIERSPADDQPYVVLTAAYGPGGPLADPATLRDAARRLFNANPDSRLYLKLVAEESLARRRYEQALEQSLSLYDTQPSDSASLRMAVSAWRAMNRLEDASRWLRRKLETRPGDPHLLEQWTTVQLLMNNVDPALSALEKQVREDPLDYAARRVLESSCQAAGRMDRALELGEQRLLERPPGNRRELGLAALYVSSGRFRDGLDRLGALLEQSDTATRGQLIAACTVAARMTSDVTGRDDLLVRLYEATRNRFDDLPLDVYRPVMLIRAQRSGDSRVFETFASDMVRDLADLDSGTENAVRLWQPLAQQLVDAGHAQAAATLIRTRLLARPELRADVHSVLCLVTFSAQAAAGGQAEASIRLLRDLRQRDRLPTWPTMAEQPTLAEALYELSQMYNVLGDEDGSLVVLRELISVQPNHAMGLNNLGYMLIERGDSDDRTVRMIELAHSLDPDEPNILDTIGWLRYKQGVFGPIAAADDDNDDHDDDGVDDPGAEVDAPTAAGDADAEQSGKAPPTADDHALQYISQANAIDTQPSPEALDHLGDVQWRLGRHDDAVKTWQRVVDLLNNQQEVRETIQMYKRVQQQLWWLVVVDAESIYDRNWGVILQRTQQKLQAVRQGTPPPVAPTFAELQPAQ